MYCVLTFQHFDGDSQSFLGFVFIDAQSLCHHNLAKTTFTQGLAQGQSAVIKQRGKRAEKLLLVCPNKRKSPPTVLWNPSVY